MANDRLKNARDKEARSAEERRKKEDIVRAKIEYSNKMNRLNKEDGGETRRRGR